jgi:hypothetical protein
MAGHQSPDFALSVGSGMDFLDRHAVRH